MPLVVNRWWCVDELEHLHATWCVAQGQLPYRDFFEHHTPLLYYLLAPIAALLKPELSYDRALALILISRGLVYVLGLCSCTCFIA